ncbi:MAG: PD-(D/E)XK nuclease family protein, partial [Planctomycetes bacterium]|nr:PD-(D/E)XK nuclease family protein [Planctomycetota bacterium]
AYLLASDAARQHDEAEQRRLFYVAATRARSRLILIGGDAGAGRRAWLDDIAVAAPSVAEHHISGGTARERTTAVAIDHLAAVRAVEAHEQAVARLGTEVRALDVAPSRVPPRGQQLLPFAANAPRRTDDAPATDDLPPPSSARPNEAAALGTALHAYLAAVRLDRSEPDPDLLASLDPSPAMHPMVEQFHRSPLRRRLDAADRVAREVPVTYVGDDGAHVHGILDVLLVEGDAVTILDWKTSQVDADDCVAAAEPFRPQLTAYARGVQQALRLSEPPALAVHFLRVDRTVPL